MPLSPNFGRTSQLVTTSGWSLIRVAAASPWYMRTTLASRGPSRAGTSRISTSATTSSADIMDSVPWRNDVSLPGPWQAFAEAGRVEAKASAKLIVRNARMGGSLAWKPAAAYRRLNKGQVT